MSLIRHTAWNGAATVVSTLGRVVIAGLLARRLAPEMFGAFVFVQWLIETNYLVFSFGLGGVATRFFPQTVAGDGSRFRGFAEWFFKALLASVVVTGLAAALSSVVFAGIRSTPLAVAIALWALTYALWALVSARAQGLFEFKLVAVCSVLLVTITVSGLAIPATQGSFLYVVLATSTGQFAAAIACAWRSAFAIRGRQDIMTTNDRTRIREFSGNVWVTSLVSSLVWSRGETPVIKAFLTDAAVGLYSGGIMLTGMLTQALGLLSGALSPTVSRMWDEGDHAALAAFSANVTALLMLVAGLGVGFVICFAHQIVTLVYGASFHESAGLVWILAFGVLGLSSGCASLIVQVATNARFARNTNFLGGATLFGLLIALIPAFGLPGAAVARSAVQLVVGVVTFVWLGRVLGPAARVQRNLLTLGATLSLAGCVAIIKALWLNASLVALTGVFLVYAAFVAMICAGGSLPRLMQTARALANLRST